jgi:peptidoglycan hydrolase-like protein with peptidoglycan-binding domain
MRGRDIVTAMLGWIAISAAVITSVGFERSYAAEAGNQSENVQASPALIREIQFMLLRLKMDPGPIDGVVGPQTNTAVHEFQRQSGLPVADLVNVGTVSTQFLARLRDQTSRAILGEKPEPQSTPSPAVTTSPPAVAPAPVPPAPDRFAACPYSPDDFRIGGTQYTPEKFLQVGFDGSTTRAVASLKDRLDEARQLAENIGGSALMEVQRQARVVNYFNCRLKIEQATGSSK